MAGVEAMVGELGKVERRALAQRLHNRLQEIKVRKLVIRALQEEHRGFDLLEVIGAIDARLARRVQREGEEDQAFHLWQRIERLRLRCHPRAERAVAAKSGRSPASFAASATAARIAACATGGLSGRFDPFSM